MYLRNPAEMARHLAEEADMATAAVARLLRSTHPGAAGAGCKLASVLTGSHGVLAADTAAMLDLLEALSTACGAASGDMRGSPCALASADPVGYRLACQALDVLVGCSPTAKYLHFGLLEEEDTMTRRDHRAGSRVCEFRDGGRGARLPEYPAFSASPESPTSPTSPPADREILVVRDDDAGLQEFLEFALGISKGGGGVHDLTAVGAFFQHDLGGGFVSAIEEHGADEGFVRVGKNGRA